MSAEQQILDDSRFFGTLMTATPQVVEADGPCKRENHDLWAWWNDAGLLVCGVCHPPAGDNIAWRFWHETPPSASPRARPDPEGWQTPRPARRRARPRT